FFSSRRRHTRFSRDWSSDVCSSDLRADLGQGRPRRDRDVHRPLTGTLVVGRRREHLVQPGPPVVPGAIPDAADERERDQHSEERPEPSPLAPLAISTFPPGRSSLLGEDIAVAHSGSTHTSSPGARPDDRSKSSAPCRMLTAAAWSTVDLPRRADTPLARIALAA